jgi:hypothetical protein
MKEVKQLHYLPYSFPMYSHTIEQNYKQGWEDAKNKCTCNDPTIGYCPVHDGDYGKWKWGENYADYDEYHDE